MYVRVWDCKVVIYNYVFVGFYSMPNLSVILFNLMYLVFYVGFLVRILCVRESVKTQGKVKNKKFSRVAREKLSCEVKHVLST